MTSISWYDLLEVYEINIQLCNITQVQYSDRSNSKLIFQFGIHLIYLVLYVMQKLVTNDADQNCFYDIIYIEEV